MIEILVILGFASPLWLPFVITALLLWIFRNRAKTNSSVRRTLTIIISATTFLTTYLIATAIFVIIMLGVAGFYWERDPANIGQAPPYDRTSFIKLWLREALPLQVVCVIDNQACGSRQIPESGLDIPILVVALIITGINGAIFWDSTRPT